CSYGASRPAPSPPFPYTTLFRSNGRWPEAAEEGRGDDSGVIVVAHEFAARRFGGATGALGRPVTLDGRGYSIVGVMPPGFRFPRSEEHTSELQSLTNLVCRLLLA